MAPVINTTAPERADTARGVQRQRHQPAEPRFGRRLTLPSGRALIGSALVVVAAAGVLSAHRSATAPTGERVVVVTRAVPAGTVLTADDLGAVTAELPSGTASIAASHARDVIGTRALHDLNDMDVLRPTDVAEANADLATGSVIVPVEVDRARALRGTVHAGSRVDVLATDPDGAGTAVLASDVVVVDVDTGNDDSIGASDGIGFRLALPSTAVATSVVDASVRSQLTIVVPSGPRSNASTNSINQTDSPNQTDSAAPVDRAKEADRG